MFLARQRLRSYIHLRTVVAAALVRYAVPVRAPAYKDHDPQKLLRYFSACADDAVWMWRDGESCAHNRWQWWRPEPEFTYPANGRKPHRLHDAGKPFFRCVLRKDQ